MDKKYSIVYCINTLTGGGGTARVLATKASYFAEKYNYDIHILVTSGGDKLLSYELSEKVKIHNLEKELKTNISRIPGIGFFQFLINAKRVYTRKIKEINPNFVTVLGPFFEDFIVPNICKKLNIVSVREFHFSKNAASSLADTFSCLSKIKYRIHTKLTSLFFNRYDSVVLLTHRDQCESKYKTRVDVIPNMSELGIVNITPNYNATQVISMGSMRSKVKRFDTQIKLWSRFVEHQPDWVLNIYGDGIEKHSYEDLIDQLNLHKNVKCMEIPRKLSENY